MAIYLQDIVDINLNGGMIHRNFKSVAIGSGDQNANRFGMRVHRDGVPEDLTGVSCQAVFQDPMGNNIALTSHGTVVGNMAYVTLPQACYNYEGRFCLAIKLIGGDVTGTMRIVDGVVDNTHTGGTVAPTGAVPTYQEILSQFDDMVEATQEAQSLVDAVKNNENFEVIDNWQSGKYYKLNGSPTSIDITAPNSSTNFACLYKACNPGDAFVYTGQGSSEARAYAFLSSASGENNILEISTQYAYTENFKIYAPENAAYIVVNIDKREKHNFMYIKDEHDIIEGEDIDDMLKEGKYFCRTALIRNEVENVPDFIVGAFMLEVKRISVNTHGFTNVAKIQTIYANTTNKSYQAIAYRTYQPNSGFSDGWNMIHDPNMIPLDITNTIPIQENDDLDDYDEPGVYFAPSYSVSMSIAHVPLYIDSSFMLLVLNARAAANTDTYKRQILFANKYGTASIYTRQKNAAGYGGWQLMISSGMLEHPMLLEASEYEATERLTGTPKKTIRIGTNNVAHYWNQGSLSGREYLGDRADIQATWRRWLMKADMDILFLQECEDYIDEDREINAFETLYKQFFDEDTNVDEQGGTGTTTKYRRKILNRMGLDTESDMETVETLYPGGGRKDGYFNWCMVNITGVGSVLLINMHNFAGSGTTYDEDRANYLDAIAEMITEKSPDYFIIAGDSNARSESDKTALLDFCEEMGATPANGGILGWFATAQIEETGRFYDNIIVSNNIRIDSVECDPVLVPGGFILTDHTPVTAKISFM